MKTTSSLTILILLFAACTTQTPENMKLPIAGTWKLLKGTLIENGDTTVTDYTQNISFIKIINDTHFAFMQHDISTPKDSSNHFSAGGGTYTLQDSKYTEHLDFCIDKQWEGSSFPFTITIHNDTLVQRGIEKVEKAGINRVNTEKYVRIK